MDLLKELYEGRISDDEASDIFCDTNEMDTDESAEWKINENKNTNKCRGNAAKSQTLKGWKN